MDEPLDIHASDFARDPFEQYRRLREECPVFNDERYGGFTLLTRYDDVRAAAIDWRTYTSALVGVTAIPVITHRDKPQLPIELDPPLHSALSRHRQSALCSEAAGGTQTGDRGAVGDCRQHLVYDED